VESDGITLIDTMATVTRPELRNVNTIEYSAGANQRTDLGYNFNTGDDDFRISGWFRKDSASSQSAYFFDGRDGNDDGVRLLYVGNNGVWASFNSIDLKHTDSALFDDGLYHYLAFERIGGVLYLYVDDPVNPFTQATVSGTNAVSLYNAYLGTAYNYTTTGDALDGSAYGFVVDWQGVDRQELPLDEGLGDTSYDITGNENHVTHEGSYTWGTRDDKPCYNYRGGFDLWELAPSTGTYLRVPKAVDGSTIKGDGDSITGYTWISSNTGGSRIVASNSLCVSIIGQSNALAYPNGVDSLDSEQLNGVANCYQSVSSKFTHNEDESERFTYTDDLKYVPQPQAQNEYMWGVELHLLRDLQNDLGRDMYAYHSAVGGSELRWWMRPPEAAKYVPYYEAAYENAVAEWGASNAHAPDYVVAINGEQESKSPIHAAAYESRMNSLIADWRDYYDVPDLKIMLTGLPSYYYANTDGPTVEAAKIAVADADENVYYIQCHDITDIVGGHYDGFGLKEVSDRIRARINEIERQYLYSAGFVHNGAECSIKQTDSDMVTGGTSFWGDSTPTYDEKTKAQMDTHFNNTNGSYNLWLKYMGDNTYESVQYPLDKEFTPAEVVKNENYFGGTSGALRDVDGDFILDVDGYVIFTA